jgi:Intracellular proteinase inhibitor
VQPFPFLRIPAALVLIAAFSPLLVAQDEGAGTLTGATSPVSRAERQDLSVPKPEEDSPFFIERQEAKESLAQEGRKGFGMYVPKPPRPPVGQQITSFFNGLFHTHRKDADQPWAHPMTLTVEPASPSLSQCSELDVTLKVSNRQRQMLELLYPDDQRLEILTKDATGNVVARWSQDRAFDPKTGFVAVDPSEFITYSERIPIEVQLANQSGYSVEKTVTPRP